MPTLATDGADTICDGCIAELDCDLCDIGVQLDEPRPANSGDCHPFQSYQSWIIAGYLSTHQSVSGKPRISHARSGNSAGAPWLWSLRLELSTAD